MEYISILDADDYRNWFTFDKTFHVKESIRENHLNVDSILQYAFLVDKKHINGPEVHLMLDDATIVVLNYESRMVVTYLFARPGQIKRYFESFGIALDENIHACSLNNFILKRNRL